MSRYIKLPMLLVLIAGCQKEAPAVVDDVVEAKSNIAAGDTPAVVANDISDDQMGVIVKKIMDEQYGARFNEKYQCWDYVAANLDDKQYCMKPGVATLVNAKTGKAIYFHASSRADIADDPAYAYGAVDPGLLGAFKLSMDGSGTWKSAASNKAMEFGSIGNCGCDQARFLKLGNGDFYGWTFSSGGTWQGITVLNYAIVAPQGDGFANISSIPEIREEDQEATYQIKVVDTDADKKVFPLLVSKQSKGQAAQELLVPFDDNRKVYKLPDNF
jgi:hypothetical protein